MKELVLILSFLMISGCSWNRPVKEIVYKPVLLPESLLQDPCIAVGAGETVRELGRAYLKNTACVGDYKRLLEKQRKHKLKMQELYKDGR